MRIRCINKEHNLDYLKIGMDPMVLEIGSIYDVLGIEIIRDQIFVYISDHPLSYYPSFYSIKYFQIVSNKVSKYWCIEHKEDKIKLLFEDWISDPDFMSKFINDIEPDSQLYKTLRQFEDYRNLISREEL